MQYFKWNHKVRRNQHWYIQTPKRHENLSSIPSQYPPNLMVFIFQGRQLNTRSRSSPNRLHICMLCNHRPLSVLPLSQNCWNSKMNPTPNSNYQAAPSIPIECDGNHVFHVSTLMAKACGKLSPLPDLQSFAITPGASLYHSRKHIQKRLKAFPPCERKRESGLFLLLSLTFSHFFLLF